tara:strand:- start:231 stop:935 length:705 start_codon:yes stop_codon:yes gene_type:complete
MIGLGNRIVSSQNPVTSSVVATTPGLQVWYQFNTGLTESGSNVTRWEDRSGNGNDLTQTTATNQPLKTSPAGGIHLDGTDNFMTLDTAVNLTTFTIFAAIQLDGTSLETLFGNGTDGTDFFRLNGSAWTLRTDGSSFQQNLGTSTGTDKYLVTLYSEVGASSTRYYLENNSTAESNILIDNKTFTIGDVGRNSANAQFFDGKVYEIVIYNEELSQETRESVERDIDARNQIGIF